jgi:hypothetical protein
MRTSSKAPHDLEVVRSLREGFMSIDVRWNVAGVYLQLLEAQEAINLEAALAKAVGAGEAETNERREACTKAREM